MHYVQLYLTRIQLGQYALSSPNAGGAEQTGAPAAAVPLENQKLDQDPNVTPQASVDEASIGSIRREEKIEYRDQDGNLLNEEQVSSLEGKVSFQTRYETRTRVIDAAGNEIVDNPAGAEGVAPPHPDVDREPETAADASEDGRDYPATASPEDDVSKEKSVEKEDGSKPRPGSEGREATK